MQEAPRLAAQMSLRVHPRLKDLMEKAADHAGETMNEWVARVAAKELQAPAEIVAIPRRPQGRPKKNRELAAAS